MDQAQLIKIIGKTAYNRLRKAGVDSIDRLRSMDESQLMTFAGIGPKKAKRVMQALGVNITEKQTEKKYRKLNLRTKLRGYHERIRGFTAKPQPVLSKLEDVREKMWATNELLKSISNLRYDESSPQRRQPEDYYVPFSISGALNIDDQTQDFIRDLMMEVRVNILTDEYPSGYIITKKLIRTDDEAVLEEGTDSNEKAHYNSTEAFHQVMKRLNEIYTAFRKRTPGGYFVTVLSPHWDHMGLTRAFTEQHQKDITSRIMDVASSDKAYMEYEIVMRYMQSRVVKPMLERWERWHRLFLYEKLEEEDRANFNFGAFIETPDLDVFPEAGSFFDVIFMTDRVAILEITTGVWFGIVQAKIYDFQKHYRPFEPAHVYGNDLPESFADWEVIKTFAPLRIGNLLFPFWLASCMRDVLKNYKVWRKSIDDPVIVTSNESPDWGFIIDASLIAEGGTNVTKAR